MKTPYSIEKNRKHDSRLGFFPQLRPRALKDLDAIKLCSYSARAILFMERQAPRGVYLLCAGDVKLSVSSSEGKTLVLNIAKPGDILGLVPILYGTPHEATAETLAFCELAFVPRGAFLRFLTRHPEAYEVVADQLSSQYQLACEQLRNLALSASAPEKLAKLLLDFAMAGQRTRKGAQMRFPLTHEKIAEFIGTTRETVTRTLAEFKSRRLVELRGRTLVIEDCRGLEKFVTL